MIDISTKGKGYIKEKFKLKHLLRKRLDVRLKHRPMTAAILDYDAAAKQLPVKDQGTSGSCGGQAWAGALEAAKFIREGEPVQLSAKDIYSHCFIAPEGSQESDLINYVENHGVALESDIPSYDNGQPPTEQFMETIQERTDVQDTDALNQIVISSYTFNGNDINQVKQAIDTGVTVCAFYGNNACWQTGNGVVEVPSLDQLDWGHWVFLTKYDDTKQLVTVKNSWSDKAGDAGYFYLPYSYFTGGRVMGEWTLILGYVGEYISLLEKIINVYQNIIDLIKK